MTNWDKYRRNGMNGSATINLCKAFDDLYPTADQGKRMAAHARLLECERLQQIGSRQAAAIVISGVAFTLGLEARSHECK